MNTLTKKLFLGVATILLCFAVCYSQYMASDFDQALAMVPKQPRWPSGVMFYDMQDAANAFVSQHSSTSAVEFLQTKIQDPNSRKLALLILAKLAAANQTAVNALYGQIYAMNRDAVTAIAYLDPNDGRAIAETLLSQPGPWEARKPAVEMLVALGDRYTLEMLRQMKPDEKNSVVKKALESAIPQLEYRLTKVTPNKQAEWARQEILSWRTIRETPLPRKVGAENYLAAKTLYMQGWRFSRDFLEYKLNSRNLLAIAIIGYQKEAWAVEELRKYVALKGSLGDFARSALAKIATK